MTEKELKKLNRYQLLELLVEQTERADKLQVLLDEAQKELQEQKVRISSFGSIAEASLQLSGVFEAAQEAADRYINAAKMQAEVIEENARIRSAEIVGRALSEAERIKGEDTYETTEQ